MGKYHRAHSKSHYYDVRSKKCRTPLTRAAQFLYLNRTCWNGLYRVNLDGVFNVPIGTKASVIFDGESFSEYGEALRNAELTACDYEATIDKCKKGDFLFVDPPYTVKHNHNGFAKYNENIFSWADQIRLRSTLDRAAARGVKILLSNAHHESVVDLFTTLGTVHVLSRASLISGDASFRSSVTEIAVTVNYQVPHAEPISVKSAKDAVSSKRKSRSAPAC